MKSEFALAFNEILEDKGLPREVIMGAINSAMVSAYRKSVGASAAQEVRVDIDLDKGSVGVYAEKEVTDEIYDQRTEVLLDDARKIDPNCQLGDLVMVESTPENFGRIAAQTARQAIQQKIRDAERAQQYEFFKKQEGEIVSGIVQAVNSRQATIGLDLKAEGTMQRKDMIPSERFRIHDRIRSYVAEVKDMPKGLQIVLSRGHRNFLRRLLENEVPEIYHGIVEIRSIAREPGQRAKVAVSATQQGIDPVGACVGQRGVRIQAIVRELHDEKIDVIEWNPDAAVYISKAISPARVSGVYLNHGKGDDKTAMVVVPEDQLSLAIGREGQNARLAAKLTGWRIDIMSVSEAASKALVQLRSDPGLAKLAAEETDTMARVETLLEQKEEGRVLNLDDSNLIARFVDRVEKRGEADRKVEEDARQAEIRKIRESIDPRAFELNLFDVSELKEHLQVLLQAAGMETFGDLLLRVKVDVDSILAIDGIGPKSYEEILEVVHNYRFPAIETAPEEVVTPEVVVEAEVAPVIEQPEVVEEPVQVEEPQAVAEVVEPKQVEKVPEPQTAEEPAAEDKSFEELFQMDTLRRTSESSAEEDENGQPGDKKKKGKKRKGYTVEYDPDRDATYVRHKHRNDDEWGEW
ncbi:MAG: transcription termination factor NusA [Anaerolineaceae bacterium]|nr:transcription termination factor NusA [Anaerolineaceae bacterium]